MAIAPNWLSTGSPGRATFFGEIVSLNGFVRMARPYNDCPSSTSMTAPVVEAEASLAK